MIKSSLIALASLFLYVYAAVGQSRETRDVQSFTQVNFGLPGKLYIKQGDSEKVEVQASKELLSKIETKVEGSRLLIRSVPTTNWRNDFEDVVVYVTVKQLEGLRASGSGDVIGEGTFTTSSIELKVSGSGSLQINVEANGDIAADVSGSGNLDVKGRATGFRSGVSGSGRVNMAMNIAGTSSMHISGSGKIEASGKTEAVDIHISGSGKVLGAGFESKQCDVKISGSGDVQIHVNEALDARISGSGSVSYKGNPSKVNNSSSGSGTVRKM